jgi:anti-sigma B factor antagonist
MMNEERKMNIDLRKLQDDTVFINLGENIQGGTGALEFSSIIYDLMDEGVKYVIIDLENVKMMNSSGLGMLVSAYTSLKRNNSEMCLVNIPEKIEKLIRMTRLDQILACFKTKEEAINNYK